MQQKVQLYNFYFFITVVILNDINYLFFTLGEQEGIKLRIIFILNYLFKMLITLKFIIFNSIS